jgi:predicted ATPase
LDLYFNHQGAMYAARIYSERNFIQAQSETDVFLRQQVLTNYGASLYHFGEIAQSLPHFEEMLKIHKPGLAPSFIWIHRDVSTNALVRSAKSLWFLGYADQARARCEKAIELARNDFDLFTLTAALDFSAMVYSFCQKLPPVKRLGEQLIELSNKYEFPFYLMVGKMYVGWVLAQEGDVAAGMKILEEAAAIHTIHGAKKFSPQRKAMWAEVLAQTGKVKEAIAILDEELKFVQQSGNVYFNAHIFQLRGQLLERMGATNAEVESWYQHALDFACQQGAKSLELRAANRLARLWQQQGKQREAYQLLAPIYHWFTEGFDTVDLREAKQLLDELAVHSH